MKVDPRMISAGDEEFKRCNAALCDLLFKDKTAVTVEDFIKIKQMRQESLLHYEFHQFETNEDGSISTSEFAKSLLSTLSWGKATMYLK